MKVQLHVRLLLDTFRASSWQDDRVGAGAVEQGCRLPDGSQEAATRSIRHRADPTEIWRGGLNRFKAGDDVHGRSLVR